MAGIEFYPQKEFDEDMEDKSDNDKIRVSASFVTGICLMILLFLARPIEAAPPPRSLRHCSLQSERWGTFFHLINVVHCSP